MTFVALLFVVLLVAALLRGIYQPADPPSHASVGITWHDEGVWTHSARNRALFGAWRLDEWNPFFVSPVFTGLEYLSFSTFGVGLRQARLVSGMMGILAVLFLAIGVARISSRLWGALAGLLLATNYIYVMYDRVALLEATMIGLLVVAWCCYTLAGRRPVLGLAAGLFGILAMLAKASAGFFLVALGLEALLAILTSGPGLDGMAGTDGGRLRRSGYWTLAGLALGSIGALAFFIVPNWEGYRFYNLEVYGARRSSLGLGAMATRASWFPIIHDFFTRLWPVTVVAGLGILGAFAAWRRMEGGERLLVLWTLLGSIELVLHDLGNERRFVFLIPALIGLAAVRLGRDRRLFGEEVARLDRRRALVAAPAVAFVLYVVIGAIGRLAFLYEVRPGVRLGSALALAGTIAIYATWPRIPAWIARQQWSLRSALVVAGLIVAADLLQFGQWASGRTYENHAASRAIGEWLPRGTLVQGKLANGLALENEIRPLFIGPGFGNYADRLDRDDVRYVLTYVAPRLGYEGAVIKEVLAAYPNWRIVRAFDVSETPGGQDRAALIDKMGGSPFPRAEAGRAHD